MSSIVKTWRSGAFHDSAEKSMIYSRKMGPPLPPLVFCHNHGIDAIGVLSYDFYDDLFMALAEDYTVAVVDLGGPSEWGNQNSMNAVTAARDYLAAAYGSTGKLGLVAASMGGATAFNWAKATGAQSTRFVACVEPLLDINSMRHFRASPPNGPLTYRALVDAAYGGTYSDAAHGATYSPYVYRASYPAATIPSRIWTTPDDLVVLPQFSDALAAAQPDLEHTIMTRANGTGYGHSVEALEVSAPAVLEFCRRYA